MKDHPFTVRKKFTKKILDSLKKSKEKRIREGEVYCISYVDNEFPTDKWHRLSISFIVEIKNNEIETYNLLYLGDDVSSKLLEKAKPLKSLKGSDLMRQIQVELTRTPWVFARKKLRPAKISSFVKIDREDWTNLIGMHKKPFGDLNDFFLMRDWKKENEPQTRGSKRKKKEENVQLNQQEETFTVEEDLNVRQVVFDENQPENLQDMLGTIDFDEDDI